MTEEALNSLARDFCDSEQLMWIMSGSNYPEVHLDDLRKAYRRYVEYGGGCKNK